jgi:HSP20 family protein
MPTDDFEALRHMMDEFFGSHRHVSLRSRDVWVPPTDVYETQTHIVIKMSVPGIKTSDVRVRFGREGVSISGYRCPTHEPALTAYHQMEIRNGYFERRVIIHKPVNPADTTAEYRDGFLWIRIPKAGVPIERSVTIRIRL